MCFIFKHERTNTLQFNKLINNKNATTNTLLRLLKYKHVDIFEFSNFHKLYTDENAIMKTWLH